MAHRNEEDEAMSPARADAATAAFHAKRGTAGAVPVTPSAAAAMSAPPVPPRSGVVPHAVPVSRVIPAAARPPGVTRGEPAVRVPPPAARARPRPAPAPGNRPGRSVRPVGRRS